MVSKLRRLKTGLPAFFNQTDALPFHHVGMGRVRQGEQELVGWRATHGKQFELWLVACCEFREWIAFYHP